MTVTSKYFQIPWSNDPQAQRERHIDAPKQVSNKNKLIGLVGALYIRALFKTCLTQVIGFENVKARQQRGQPTILTFWHCNLLSLVGNFLGYQARTLISEHQDGEFVAQACVRLGMGAVRGSTTRGAARALVSLKRQLELGFDIGLTPDGPKGPARQVQAGAIYLAAKTQVPIIPISVWSDSFKVFKSWDSFRMPWPGSRLVIRFGQPLLVPDSDNMDVWRDKLRNQMEEEELKAKEDFDCLDFKGPRGSWTLLHRDVVT